jgi:hypothetical protein
MTRGGITGKFAAAASGNREQAYLPPQSQQSILQSALSGPGRTLNGQQTQLQSANERTGPNRVDRQDYSRMAPPDTLQAQDAVKSFQPRGRGRGARGGLGSINSDGHGRGVGPFRGQSRGAHTSIASHSNGVSHQVPAQGNTEGGSARGGPGGRGRGRGRGGFQSNRGVPSTQTESNGTVSGEPAKAPVL